MAATLYKQAVGLARAGRKEEARELLQQVLELNPLNESAWIWFADTFSTVEERISVLEECLKSIPLSNQARQGLAQLRQISTDADMPTLSNQPFNTSRYDTPPELTQSFFVDGPGDFSVNSIFTVSPDEVTQADVEAAERDLIQNNRRLVEDYPVDPIFNDEDLRKTLPGFESLYKEEAAGETPPASTSPAAPNSWLPVFSDEISSPDQSNRWSEDNSAQDEGSDWFKRDGPSEADDSKTEPSEEDLSERWSTIKWTEQSEATEPSPSGWTIEKKTPPQPVESRVQNLIFYLVIAVAIVLILLLVVLMRIFLL